MIAGEPLPSASLRLFGQLADALAYAHGRGIVHCDLKPANIHVLANGATKILDFGIARAVARPDDDTEPLDRPVFGTPGYLSPERMLGREATASSDVYALGVVTYQLLTGVQPFRTDDEAQLFLDTLTATPLPPSTLVAGIPPEVDQAVLRCLSKNARERLHLRTLRALNSVLRSGDSTGSGQLRRAAGSRPVENRHASGHGSSWCQRRETWSAVRSLSSEGLQSPDGMRAHHFNDHNGPLGLVGRFRAESAILWPVWGVRSLIAVIGESLAYSVAILIVTGITRLAATVSPFRRLYDPIITRARRAAERMHATPIAMLAPALLILQLLVFAVLLWRFQPIVSGLDAFLMRRSPRISGVSDHNRPDQNFPRVVGQPTNLRGRVDPAAETRSDHKESDGRASIWAGIAMLGFSVIIFQVAPFRVIYHNESERITYNGDRCYVVGQSLNEALSAPDVHLRHWIKSSTWRTLR